MKPTHILLSASLWAGLCLSLPACAACSASLSAARQALTPAGHMTEIMSENMYPALAYGARFLVRPLAPGTAAARGTVIAFCNPRDTDTVSFSRVIGLPGDHIAVAGNAVLIDGKPVGRQPDGTGQSLGDALICFRELLGTTTYRACQSRDAPGPLADMPEQLVPENHLFVLGDNRDHSADSREADFGFVPADDILGEVVMPLTPTASR